MARLKNMTKIYEQEYLYAKSGMTHGRADGLALDFTGKERIITSKLYE